MSADAQRTSVLYLAPWVDFGGSDKGTIDWFRWLDHDRFRASLITTQPSLNRRLEEVRPYADEVWALPELMAGHQMPQFIFDFLATRAVDVVHVMNSRLGFELLPDLAALPRPPRVVVQLHVEEQDRSGYVRYVTTRFGNLVDAFSVTSDHLAAALEAYDVPPARIHVIRTGVDAEAEFSPERITPVAGFEADAFHVLYPGRLVEQKDPLLMVDVVARAAARAPRLRVHVVGEGPLEPAVRNAVRERGLEGVVRFNPATNDLAPWYGAADALLMTSVFEGVPYVVYEAMAMGLAVVAPALPGNAEALGADDGLLISPRDDAAAYADALTSLAGDPGRRAALGARNRERAIAELSVRAMAEAHARVYDRLTAGRPAAVPALGGAPAPAPARLPARPRTGTPLVTVLIPCFNHGRYLGECIAAVRAQTWPAIEIVVVDDASTDPDTLRALDELERTGGVELIRQPENRGPGAARNAGIERARGRYVLPVDADNVLLPEAVAELVAQLAEAGENVGFIYPNLQYFGTRRDYFEVPAYNLYALLQGNYCDTCSLVDRSVYDAGVRFDEGIRLGHEDWDFALRMAAAGIAGEPARTPTLRYRKQGFTRSDLVEHSRAPFAEQLRELHPELYGEHPWGDPGPYTGPALTIKARSAPGISVVALAPSEPDTGAGRQLAALLARQTAGDAELILRSDAPWPAPDRGPAIRRIPAALAATPAAALQDALACVRGNLVVVTTDTGAELLADRAALEQVARAFAADPGLRAMAFLDGGGFRMQALTTAELGAVHAVAVPAERLPGGLRVDEASPVGSLVHALGQAHSLQGRHLAGAPAPPSGTRTVIHLAPRAPLVAGQRRERELRARIPPSVPALRPGFVPRWRRSLLWTPPETLRLCRHKQVGGTHRVVSNHRDAPPGYALEYDIGAVNQFQAHGTAELRHGGPEGYFILPDPGGGIAPEPGPRHPETLGFAGQAPLPLLDALQTAFHPPSGQWLLVCGPGDPLDGEVTERRHLGFIEAVPNNPPWPPGSHLGFGLRPLLRSVDASARRHRHALDEPPAGELSLELGALLAQPADGSIPVWLEDDRVITAGAGTPAAHPSLGQRARWVAAPVIWRGAAVGPLAPRARASARRLATVTQGVTAPPPPAPPTRPPDAYLWPAPGEDLHELFAAIHPVTGDQMLTRWPLEARDMGYGEPASLGWARTLALRTGTLSARPVAVPWASRFGRAARRS